MNVTPSSALPTEDAREYTQGPTGAGMTTAKKSALLATHVMGWMYRDHVWLTADYVEACNDFDPYESDRPWCQLFDRLAEMKREPSLDANSGAGEWLSSVMDAPLNVGGEWKGGRAPLTDAGRRTALCEAAGIAFGLWERGEG